MAEEQTQVTRPPFTTDYHLRFLDSLQRQTALIREPGWWMRPTLNQTFSRQLDSPKAGQVLRYWLHLRRAS